MARGQRHRSTAQPASLGTGDAFSAHRPTAVMSQDSRLRAFSFIEWCQGHVDSRRRRSCFAQEAPEMRRPAAENRSWVPRWKSCLCLPLQHEWAWHTVHSARISCARLQASLQRSRYGESHPKPYLTWRWRCVSVPSGEQRSECCRSMAAKGKDPFFCA